MSTTYISSRTIWLLAASSLFVLIACSKSTPEYERSTQDVPVKAGLWVINDISPESGYARAINRYMDIQCSLGIEYESTGDSIVARLRMLNTSERPIRLDKERILYDGVTLDAYAIVDESGRRLPYRGLEIFCAEALSPESFYILEPHSAITTYSRIDNIYEFDDSGIYRIHYEGSILAPDTEIYSYIVSNELVFGYVARDSFEHKNREHDMTRPAIQRVREPLIEMRRDIAPN